MINKLLLFIFFVFLLQSCKKENDVEITLHNEGGLSMKVTDDKGVALTNIGVYLYDIVSYGLDISTQPLDSLRTNEQGFVDFGKLKPSTYMLKLVEVKLGKLSYTPYAYYQVIANQDVQKTLDVTTFSGTVDISVLKYNPQNPDAPTPALGYRAAVLLYSNSPEDWNYLTDGDKERAVLDVAADENGKLNFRLPADMEYYVAIYNPQNKRIEGGVFTVFMSKDHTFSNAVTIY